MAGGEKHYVEAGGERYLYTNKSLRYMTANLVIMAWLLAANLFTTNLLEEDKKQKPKAIRKRNNIKKIDSITTR